MAIAPAPSCNTTYCSTNCCKYGITNEGSSAETYSYTSCTDSSYVTATIASGQTIVICSIGPPTCSAPVIYGLEGCCDTLYTFQECGNSSNKFIFTGLTSTLNVNDVYYIVSSAFTGYASVITFEQSANIYDGTSAIFTQQTRCPSYSGITTDATGWSYYDYCGDLRSGTAIGENVCVDTSKEYSGISISSTICYGVCKRAALLQKCSDSSIFYALVDEDTAFVGAVYIHEGNCYSFVEFSGPGGPDLGEPDYGDCSFCTPVPTVPILTPSITPSITPTIPSCNQTQYCFRTNLAPLSSYSGEYISAGTYNSRIYYTGSSSGYIYFDNTQWCLSSSLGGSCLLKGSSPCSDPCPDFYNDFFYSGVCITPTPTPTAYNTVSFDAIFECDFEPTPTTTPTPTVTPTVTPTMTMTPSSSAMVGIDFTIEPYTATTTSTPTPTPTLTLTKTVAFSGAVNFTLFEESFSPVAAKVMRDCSTAQDYYVGQDIIYNSSGITLGQVAKVSIDGNIYCLQYMEDSINISPNIYLTDIYDLYDNCSNCFVTPTPTPTLTPTVTPTITATITPTPSVSSNMVYVFKSCVILPEQTGIVYLKQTEPHMSALTIGNVVKDSYNNCWEYVGIYPSSYVSPFDTTEISFFGNYFAGVTSPIFLNCNSC